MAKRTKTDIKYAVTLDEDQKKVKADIYDSQIVIVTGRAGSGKSLVCALTALDLMFQKEVSKIYVTRANIETGRSLGYLPGSIDEKFNPYLEAFKENLFKGYADAPDKKLKLNKHFSDKDIDAMPIAFIRGKTIDDILVIEEAQNLTVHEVSSIVSRLGKTGRIVFNGDFDQCDIKPNHETGERVYTGLHYLKDMSVALPEIKMHHLESNHRSDLVGKILDWEYSRKKKND
jgi:phosphate starvation-inducible PhoH-like protein